MPRPFGDRGCRFLVDARQQCGATRRTDSSYCAGHHALCHLVLGSAAERERVRLIDWLGRVALSRAVRAEAAR